MIAGDRAGGGYLMLTLISFLVVTPIAYALHSRVTFKEPLSLRSLFRFALGVSVGLPLSLGIMAVLCSLLKLPVVVAAPMATVLLFLWNYMSAHISILGRKRRSTRQSAQTVASPEISSVPGRW
jgi:putative flippase GtrA